MKIFHDSGSIIYYCHPQIKSRTDHCQILTTKYSNIHDVRLSNSAYINIIHPKHSQALAETDILLMAPELSNLIKQENKNVLIWVNL